MLGLIALAATFAVAWIGYGAARRFVRERLRYVEAALKPSAAVIAGVVATLVALPVVSLLHWIPLIHSLIGGGTALIFGMSVGLGVRSGAQDVKRGWLIGPGA